MIVNLITYLAILSIGVTFIIGITRYKILSLGMKIIVWYFLINFITELIAMYMSLRKLNNMVIFHIYTPIEYSMFILIFSYWQKERLLKLCLRFSIPLFLLFNIYSKNFWEGIGRFDNISTTVEGVILVVISIYSLIRLSKEEVLDIVKDSRFWVCFAVLIYFFSNIIFFAFRNIIVEWSLNKLEVVLITNSIIVIISSLLFIKGFLCEQ